VENLVGEGVVLDFSHKQDGEEIVLEELQVHAGRLKRGDIVFIRTDMDKLYRTARWAELPYIAPEALEWLIDTFAPKIIGTDAGGFEVPGTDHQPNHLKMFQHGIAMVESATNLAALGDDRALIFVLALPIEGIDACPARIVAIRKEDLCNDSGSDA
jgi:arylformamidase